MISVPESFQVPPFYEQTTINLSCSFSSFKDKCRAVPFYYDITEEVAFWTNKHDILPLLLEWWSEEEERLTKLYSDRNPSKAKPIMVTMIAVYIDGLFWTNEKQVLGIKHLKEELSGMQFKPVNCHERLTYILSNPSQYHSFIQLKALFLELKKLYAKSKVIKHINKNKDTC
jgi:hypothetical protein